MDEPVELVVSEDPAPPRRRRWPFLVAAVGLVVASLGVAALLVDDDEGTTDLATVASSTERSGTARLRVDVDGGGPDSEVIEGEVDFARDIAHIRAEDGSMEVITVGNVNYVRFSPEARWVKIDALPGNEAEDTLASAYDPTTALAMLREDTTASEVVGKEQVRGVRTEHSRLTVEMEETDEGPQRVDVWIDDDDRLRRMEMHFDDPGLMRVRMEFWDFGVALDLQAPPPDQVTEDPEELMSDADAAFAAEGEDLPVGEAPELPRVAGPWARVAAGDGVPGGWALWLAPGEEGTTCPSMEVDGRPWDLADLPPPVHGNTYDEMGLDTHEGNLVFCQPAPPPDEAWFDVDPAHDFDGVRLVVGQAGEDVTSVDITFRDGRTRTVPVDPGTKVFAAEIRDGVPERFRLGGSGRTCTVEPDSTVTLCQP